jgi:hypothetical protein
MTSTPRPEGSSLTCALCHQPINLDRDRYADENGKIVHEDCYVKRLMSPRQDPPNPQHTE